MDTPYDDHLQVFFGQASHAEAYIYVELSGMETAGWEIVGYIRGPQSRFAHTLPATIPLRQSSTGSTLLAEAIVPDPCFWLPEAPYRYTVQIELRRDGETVFKTEREFGIRPLAARGHDLILLAKRWVLRGVWLSQPSVESAAACREASASLLCERADKELYRQATEEGVVVAVQLSEDNDQIAVELARLARWPAVGMVVLPETVADVDKLALPRNLLLGQRFHDGKEIQPAEWADVVLVECREVDRFAELVASCQLPVIAYRSDASAGSVSQARVACDALQRDLAPHGDFAGYVITL